MSLKTVLLLTILNSVAWGQYTPLTPSESYTNSYIVNSADPGLYQIFWKRIGTDEIQFEVHCKTLGWVGFGISPAGGMTGADITKFWIRDGLIFLFDTYATGNSSPRTDTIQNVSWLGGAEVNDYTIVKFKRKLVTGDTQHDINIINGNQIFIFAFSTIDPVTGDGDWSYHGRNNRFSATLNLLAAGSGRY